jgi:hypothetical protein
MKWIANYNDGTSLPQFNEDGTENKYIDIDRSKLSSFDMVEDKLILSVILERPTQKLICRRRVCVDLFGNFKSAIWLVGWHENIGGKSIKSICYIYSDGHIELAGARDDIQLITGEK